MLELALVGEHEIGDIAALLGASEKAIFATFYRAMTKYARAMAREGGTR